MQQMGDASATLALFNQVGALLVPHQCGTFLTDCVGKRFSS
jgi:hypothetical protein